MLFSRNIEDKYFLLAAAVASVLLVAYPHMLGVNPNQHGVSTDEQYYVNWITKLRSQAEGNSAQLIHDAFSINTGDRPFTLLLLISLSNLTQLPDLLIIRFIPLLLAPALVISSYAFVRFGFYKSSTPTFTPVADSPKPRTKQKRWMAIIVGFLAAFSPQIIVGMYAGLLANWLAIILGFVGMVFLIRFWNSPLSGRMLLIHASFLTAIMTFIMLFHAYSFWYFSAAFGIFVVVSFLYDRSQIRKTLLKGAVILMALTPGILLDLSKPVFSAIPPGIEAQGNLVQKQIAFGNFNLRIDNLSETVQTYVGGYLAAPLMWLLVLVWLVKTRSATSVDRLILSMLFVMTIPLLFGSVEFQTRVLYNMPLQIPAALAVMTLLPPHGRIEWIRFLGTGVILLALCNYALSSMANLPLVLPDGYQPAVPVVIP